MEETESMSSLHEAVSGRRQDGRSAVMAVVEVFQGERLAATYSTNSDKLTDERVYSEKKNSRVTEIKVNGSVVYRKK